MNKDIKDQAVALLRKNLLGVNSQPEVPPLD